MNIESDEGFALRMRKAAELAGGPIELSRKTGLSRSVVGSYLAGKSDPSRMRLISIAHAAGVSLNWLATGEGSMHGNSNALARTDDMEGYIFLPRHQVQASAGAGAIVHSERIVDYLALKEDWVRTVIRRNPNDLRLIEAQGDSMEPTISHGDLLLVDMSVGTVRDGAIYVLSYDGTLLVKRINRRITGEIVVKSDNPAYDPDVLPSNGATNLQVIGQVVWHGGLV